MIEGEGWVVGGYNLKGNAKEAVRSLSTLVSGLVTVAIWVIVFSPFWGGGLVAVIILVRISGRRSWRSRPDESIEPKQVSATDKDPNQ